MIRCPFCLFSHPQLEEHRLSCDCGASLRLSDSEPAHPDGQGMGGGLARANAEGWARAARDRREFTESIARCDALVRKIGQVARRMFARRGKPCPVTISVFATCVVMLWNEARRRAGDTDAMVSPRVHREHDFGSLRHVLAFCGESSPTLGMGPPAFASSGGGGSGGGDRPDAKGQDAIHRRLDGLAAVRAAGLTEEEATMLQLVDHGVVRSRARRTRQGIDLAVEAVGVAEAGFRAGLGKGLAREVLKSAREKVRAQLRACAMIPPPRERREPMAPMGVCGG